MAASEVQTSKWPGNTRSISTLKSLGVFVVESRFNCFFENGSVHIGNVIVECVNLYEVTI